MKVSKVADVINGEVVHCCSEQKIGEFAGILTSLESVAEPRPGSSWHLPIIIDPGTKYSRELTLTLPPLIRVSDPLDNPLFLGGHQLVFFLDRLFLAERPAKTNQEREEIILRVKKTVYEEEADVVNLKASVANLEAAIQYTNAGPKRDAVPDDVKLVVWARDGGACIRCGSKQNLHFDHVIPVVKGGGNSAENIQVLCQICNLKKGDRITA
jgi:HNH endonuclease